MALGLKFFLARLPKQLLQIKSALANLASDREALKFGVNHIAAIFLELIAD